MTQASGAADWLGWAATVVFASSYFFSRPAALRLVQAFGAGLWMGYGVLIGAPPVIVANLLVGGIALYSTFRRTPGPEER